MRHEPIDLPRSLGSVIRKEPAPVPAGPRAGETVDAAPGGSTHAHGFEFVNLFDTRRYRWVFDGANWIGGVA